MTEGIPGWDWIGLTDEEANLSKPFATNGWLLPNSVEIRRKRLFYEIGFPPRFVRPGPSLLAEFVQLADREAESIVRFAKKWGVLRFCRHGLPYPHEALSGARPWTRRVSCFPGRVRRGSVITSLKRHFPVYWLWEPIEAWQQFARHARALLNLTSEVRRGRTGSDEDWKFLTGLPIPRLGQEPPYSSIERDPWTYIANNLNCWFRLTPVTLRFSLEQGRLKIDHSAQSLFPYLQMQLAFAVGQGAGLCICSGCGEPYPPPRRPNPNRNSYCDECGRKASCRDASARYRRKSFLKCAKCGDSHRSGAKFCNACGGSLKEFE
jgi:hypothetical protein